MNQQDAERKKELGKQVAQLTKQLKGVYAAQRSAKTAKERREHEDREKSLLKEMQPLNDELAEIAVRNAPKDGE